MHQHSAVLDHRRLEEHFAMLKADYERSPLRWTARNFVRLLVFGFAVAVISELFAGDARVLTFSRTSLIRWVIAPFALATILTIWSAWYQRRRFRLEASVLADRVEREHAKMTQRGWVRTCLQIGAKLTLWIGVLVAASWPSCFRASRRFVNGC
jgi:hypothetical protein